MPRPDPLSLTGARWVSRDPPRDRVSRLASRAGLSEVAARVVTARWPDTEAEQVCEIPELGHLHDPMAMRNMGAALELLRRAARDRHRVRIITDYDVDGTTSSLILQAALKLIAPGCEVSYHIPNRFDEGYGFSVRAAEQAAEDQIDLIVTADIGVRDHAAVSAAHSAGVAVLICDHHLPAGAAVPSDATVLCPPQDGDTYPNRSLAACGVSLKVAQALLEQHPKREAILSSMLKLAAIGTVADLVPLTTRENRAIVALGLDALNHGRHHAGLASLLEVSGVHVGRIRASDLGYRIGPRINAAGRVADARLVIRLLTERNAHEAAELAAEINRLNDQRRAIQRTVESEALERVGDPPPAFVVVADREEAGWHRGVVGIVASRLKDEVNRPVAVVSIQGDTAVGSVRSPPGLHAVEALDSVADLLVKYGGHPAAAGFTVPTHHLDALAERLAAWASARSSGEVSVPVRRHDGSTTPEALTEALFEELARLGPWGMGSPSPKLVLPAVQAVGVQVIGKDGTHLKFRIPQRDGRTIDAIWFSQAMHAETIRGQPVDVLGSLTENHYRGQTTLQFLVADARPATGVR